MKDEQDLRKKRDKIIQDVALRFPPSKAKVKEFISDTNVTLHFLDDDLYVKGRETLIAETKAFLAEHKKAFDDLNEATAYANIKNDTRLGIDHWNSEKFYWACWVKFGDLLLNLLKVSKTINDQSSKKLTYKEIAIAYRLLGQLINGDNASQILAIHAPHLKTPKKLLDARISNVGDLTKVSDDPTAATKHLNSLMAVKHLLNGTKNKTAIKKIEDVILTYSSRYKQIHHK